MTRFRGSQVLVTGAASGIGRLMALGAACRGASLVLWDIDDAALSRVVSEIRAAGSEAVGFRCDVSDREAVYETAGKLSSPVDILINNAGVVSGASLLDVADEKIERSFAVNTLALFWTTKAFLPAMIERDHGHIVTIASAGGLIGVSHLSDYCASKFGAVGFDESLRVELKERASAVRTTVVCPYFIDTGMFDGVRTRFSFLLPVLKEERVAERVLRAVERNRPQLLLPPLVHSIPLLRSLPVSWFDAIARLMGIQAAMKGFRGRNSD